MAGLISRGCPSAEEQQKNDRHNPLAVAAVLAYLGIYLYLFTQAAQPLGLSQPLDLAANLGIQIEHVFDDDGNVDSDIYIPFTDRFNNDDERLILFLGCGLAFLLAYFLPLPYKQPALSATSLGILGLLYGLQGICGLLFCHVLTYLILHPVSRHRLWLAGLPGCLGTLAFHPYATLNAWVLTLALFFTCVSIFVYKFLVREILARPKAARILRTVTVQSAMITVLAGSILAAVFTGPWMVTLGILLFFWQWQRLILYHIDYKDGQIPPDISLPTYLSIFITPGQIPNWGWGAGIGQGHVYTTHNFYGVNKNTLVWLGLRLWTVSLVYLVLGDWLRIHLVHFLRGHGHYVYWRTSNMACSFGGGESVETSTVLLTTLIDLIRMTLLYSGVLHFKVGLWRICGYKVDPYYYYPWLSTNLVSLWSRFAFHFRAFLVKTFYYPVFFSCFKQNVHLRIFAATMAAACFGNLVWGHMSEVVFFRGVDFDNLALVAVRWPYYVLLGLGITVSEFWLFHKKKNARKPWTQDRKILLDVLAAYITLQFFALIHIFSHPCNHASLWDHWRLFCLGLGIHL